jgi:hypothetical protein
VRILDARHFAKPTTAEAIRLGEAARRLIDDNALQLAMERLERKLVRQWHQSKDPVEQSRAWAMTHALTELQRELQIIIDDGEHARLQHDPE